MSSIYDAMTSEKLNDAYSAKLDEIIQFFVRERESKIHYITFGKENIIHIYANFLAAISIVIVITSILEKGMPSLVISLIVLAGMIKLNKLISKRNEELIDDYKNTTHKFDVIISSLQILRILNKDKELSKLVCVMKKRPVESEGYNESYKKWLTNVYNCANQFSTCD